jgi:predicted transglutaminase-like cysteine proteinase
MSIVIQNRSMARYGARCRVQKSFAPISWPISWALWLGILLAAALPLLAPRPAASLAGSMPLSFASEVEADSFIDDGTTTASLEAEPVAVKSPAAMSSSGGAAPLFGMETAPLIGGAIPEKWTRARAEIAREFESLERCRTGDACPVVAQRLMDLSAEGTGRSGRARVGLINRAVDLAISPTSDDTQWGVDDRWSAPFETLRSGRGDCEDYAIVKYLALLEAGLSEDDVKIVILKTAFPSEDHAVLAVRVDGDWLILDNRTLTLVRDMDLRRATPEFVLDRQGARRFVPEGRSRRVG